MTRSSTPAFIISGTSSGSGKTTVALGLMAAFREKGYQVQPFKCGPDFIDPGLHQLVTGKISRNLDLWMAGEGFSAETLLYNSQNVDIAIIEGVMGMFDGGHSSSGTLSAFFDIPNVLVLDVRSMAESAAAIVKGFATLNPKAKLAGVILNKIASPRHLELVCGAIKEHCDVEILGYLPRTIDFTIPSRHLGLLTGDESPISQQSIKLLAQSVIDHIDLEKLYSLSRPPQFPPLVATREAQRATCRIGVARDKAFCFYYEDNFDILKASGAELVFFSPLQDTHLPEKIDGLYLGGGYPELYGRELSANHQLKDEITEWIKSDRAVYAECGGFMYLTEGITDHDDIFHPMVGAFPVKARMKKQRASLGYREITTVKESCFGPAGTLLRGHEFHYSHIDKMPEQISRVYNVNNATPEGYSTRRVLGGYMHLHFGYSPDVAHAFINYCRE